MGPGNAQLRRSFLQFSDVRVLSPAIGNSNYHGMNVKLEKRYSAGVQFQANYTWSRFIDDVESRNEVGGNPGSAFANVYYRRADRGLSGNQLAHRNAGRTAGYGPGAIFMNLSVLKDFPLREGHRLQFRTEMLNFINKPNFGLPNLLRGNPAFGQIRFASVSGCRPCQARAWRPVL